MDLFHSNTVCIVINLLRLLDFLDQTVLTFEQQVRIELKTILRVHSQKYGGLKFNILG